MKPALITGGAGFVATNVADRLLSAGQPVILFDNLSRAGVERNVEWLCARHGRLVTFERGDIRNADAVRRVVRRAAQIYHFAAQVAVTTSLVDPFADFEVNARGTLNVLEAARACPSAPPVLFTSTNKVYGDLHDVALRATPTRYEPADDRLRRSGISERRSLDFHSPYGCSKGVADQYVLDYCRTFRMRGVVFRMSCIYGTHQFGTEDQGWIAYFLIAALNGRPLTIYGDGRQVRDVLFVDDLVDAMCLAQANIDRLSGQAFNIGGGPRQTTSLSELLELITEVTGEHPQVGTDAWRAADQRYYVSDTTKFGTAVGWRPRVSVRRGVTALIEWLVANQVVPSLPAATEAAL
jgi:CDP-paratose 2-epimerase